MNKKQFQKNELMKNIGFYRDKNQNLSVQNIKVSELVKKYGTPLYIYDTNLIKQIFLNLQNALKPINGKIYYAIKANDNIGIIKYLSQLGAGADVVSIGELEKSLAAGVNPNRIVFSGVGKQRFELKYAIEKNIQQLNI